MKKSAVASMFVLLLAAMPARAGDAEQIAVVQRYVKAWNDSDAQALIALRAADARNYRPPADAAQLVGDLSAPLPTAPDARLAYYRTALARTPHPHVEMLDAVAMDDLVVSRERVSNLPDGADKQADELTIYQVRDGVIQALWHVRRAVR